MIWHEHSVCSECFTLLKRSDIAERDDWGNKETYSWRTDEASLGEALVQPPPTVANCAPKAEQRTTCNECGSVRGLSQSDTLSTSAAIDRVPALVSRLREAGYAVEKSRVYDSVRHLKSLERHEADDKRIFAVAAALGVRS